MGRCNMFDEITRQIDREILEKMRSIYIDEKNSRYWGRNADGSWSWHSSDSYISQFTRVGEVNV